MIVEIGFGLLALGFLLSGYAILASWYGMRRSKRTWIDSARAAMTLILPVLSVSSILLIYLLLSGHYEVHYVYQVVSESMPFYLKLTALWGGQAGSLLFWTWMLSLFGFAAMQRNWDLDRDLLPWVVMILAIFLIFFIGLTLFLENPFTRYWQLPGGDQVIALLKPQNGVLLSPSDGQGLNPLLRHPGMIFHPPALYLGFSAFIIPYVFAMSSLCLGHPDDRWLKISRPWALLAWLFLSAGLLLGSRWAYEVLGWGGYWAWDPVENAAFMPWLLGTAFLHGMMVQKRFKLFKRWTMFLILMTFSIVIYGIFLSRAGVLSSVHAFAESSIGPVFFLFLAFQFIVSLVLLFYRWGNLSSEGSLFSFFSRESLVLLSTVLLFALFLIIFLGVNFPLVSQLFTGQKMTVGSAWYEQTTGPLFAGILFLMAVSPMSAWRYTTGKTLVKALRLPLLLSLLVICLVFYIGIRHWAAVLGYWLVALYLLVLVIDFGSAFRTRKKRFQESAAASLLHLHALNRRRYGSLIIHISVALMTIGILGIELYQTETQARLNIGESVSLGPYTLKLQSIAEFDLEDGRNVARAVIQLSSHQIPVTMLYPRRDFYYVQQQSVTIPGIYSTLKDDLYVVLVDWEPINSTQATFNVFRNLLINWLWLGGFGLLVGGGVLMWDWHRYQKNGWQ
jgi:cytochrome c-type biogenesis protein CcmF